jgi:demethylmenaquinone methyltransferase / 2-methoxy-6-polyprenyl-1,4-benzoquinol methylase
MSSERGTQVSRRQFAVNLFDNAAFGYDLIAQALSYGQYLRWQRALIAAVLRHGVDRQSIVLDVATGTAGVARHLVRESGCRVVGLDQSPGMLAAARKKLATSPPDIARRIHLVEGTGDQLPFPDDYFDAVTFTYLFRYVDDPAVTMRELVRVARPGALVGFIEFHLPPPPWKQLWYIHTRVVLPVAGRLISDGWSEVGRFLGPSIERFYSTWDVPGLRAILEASGLREVEHRVMSLGGGLVMWGRKREIDE